MQGRPVEEDGASEDEAEVEADAEPSAERKQDGPGGDPVEGD